jgi:protein-S-isoprenylcysteine O-methyltransferase Ste14
MSLRNEFESSGSWFFRYRSYLPVCAVAVFLAAIESSATSRNAENSRDFWDFACLLVSLLGLVVRAIAVGYAPEGTSGRNTRKQIAKTLNTTGMYSVVRHPLYFGNLLIVLGLSFFVRVWWMVLLVTSIFMLFYERIMFAEEAFLRKRFGDAFEQWAGVTPGIIPRMHGWKTPLLPFSVRTVLSREYTGFFGIISAFSFFELAAGFCATGTFGLRRVWMILLGLAAVLYVVLRALKKHTVLLHVSGR